METYLQVSYLRLLLLELLQELVLGRNSDLILLRLFRTLSVLLLPVLRLLIFVRPCLRGLRRVQTCSGEPSASGVNG